MQKYFAYTRVSSTKQGALGVSLDEQRAAITAYAARNGLTISRWFEEVRTAARSGRHHFSELMLELHKGHAAGVVLHKVDRGARNLHDWAAIGDLIDAGVDVRFAHDDMRLDSRGGRLAADIQAVIAADYVRNLREETRKGIRGRLNQGLLPRAAPIGYVDQGGGKPKLPHPEHAGLIVEAFRLYATGRYTLKRLSALLFRFGLTGRTGAMLSVSGLARILHNPFYVGLIRNGAATYQGVHHPLISQALFDEVQVQFRRQYPKRTRRGPSTYSRFITHDCGYRLIGERQKGHTYYRCHHCRGASFREEKLSALMARSLAEQHAPHDAGILSERIHRYASGAFMERGRVILQARQCLLPGKVRFLAGCRASSI